MSDCSSYGKIAQWKLTLSFNGLNKILLCIVFYESIWIIAIDQPPLIHLKASSTSASSSAAVILQPQTHKWESNTCLIISTTDFKLHNTARVTTLPTFAKNKNKIKEIKGKNACICTLALGVHLKGLHCSWSAHDKFIYFSVVQTALLPHATPLNQWWDLVSDSNYL